MSGKEGMKACVGCSHRFPASKLKPYTNDAEIKTLFEDFLQIDLVPHESLPKAICVNCIVRINSCLDTQRSIIRNMFNHRIRYYHNRGDRDSVERYRAECSSYRTSSMKLPAGMPDSIFNEPSTSRVVINPSVPRPRHQPERIMNNDTGGLIISDVRTEELPQEPDSTGDDEPAAVQPSTSDFSETSTTASAELLEPMFQTSENANETESGGNIHVQNAALSTRRKKSEPISLKCTHCDKIYRQVNAWRKHIRTHLASDQRKSISEKPKHKCPECPQAFESAAVLKKHSIIHAKKFTCEFCGNISIIEYAHKWHRIECVATRLAKDVSVAEPSRRTRSQGRPDIIASMARRSAGPPRRAATTVNDGASRSSRSSLHSTSSDSMYHERIAVVGMWTKQLGSGDKPDQDELDSKKRESDDESLQTEVSGMTRISGGSGGPKLPGSVPRSRKSTTSSVRAQEQERRNIHRTAKRLAKLSGKEYYPCSYRNLCSFGSTSLSKTMYHEVHEHNALLLHYCVECNQWFTSRDYLLRHKKSHRPSMHLCILCHHKFDWIFELQFHTTLHTLKTFNCLYCDMTFLKRVERQDHTFRYHYNEPLRKFNIIERFSVPGKSTVNPYLRKPIFQGYKSKDMIQIAPLPDPTPPINIGVENQPSTSGTQTLQPHDKRKVARSESSSCYSDTEEEKPQIGDEEDDDIILIDDENFDPDGYSDNGSFIERPMSPVPLEFYDIFSIDALGMDDRRASRSRRIDIELFDHYFPPYDIIFGKYLKKYVRNVPNIVEMDTH